MHMASNALKEVERLTEPSAGKCKKFLEKRAHALEKALAFEARLAPYAAPLARARAAAAIARERELAANARALLEADAAADDAARGGARANAHERARALTAELERACAGLADERAALGRKKRVVEHAEGASRAARERASEAVERFRGYAAALAVAPEELELGAGAFAPVRDALAHARSLLGAVDEAMGASERAHGEFVALLEDAGYRAPGAPAAAATRDAAALRAVGAAAAAPAIADAPAAANGHATLAIVDAVIGDADAALSALSAPAAESARLDGSEPQPMRDLAAPAAAASTATEGDRDTAPACDLMDTSSQRAEAGTGAI